MKFNFVVETPKQDVRPQQQRESNVDWNAVNDYQANVLTIGKHQLLGVVTQLYDLGIQERPEQVIVWDAKGQADHGWRLEVYENSGKQKDESARLEQRKFKGKSEECLIFQPKDVAQMAIAVDFPEKMLNLGQFFNPDGESSEKPFRDIIGQNGFNGFRNIDGKRVNVIARPFNLLETNVNSKKKDAPVHMAFAKNSMVHNLADYCGVLDGEGNFHISDISKLLGKVCMFEVEVKWNTWKDKTTGEEKRKLETDIRPASRMSPRDEAYFNSDIKSKIDESMLGGLLFSGGNAEQALKEVRAVVLNTMQLAKNWEGSVLKQELEALAGQKGEPSSTANPTPTTTTKPPEPQPKPSSQQSNTVVAAKVNNVVEDEFEDDQIPF